MNKENFSLLTLFLNIFLWKKMEIKKKTMCGENKQWYTVI